MFARTERFCGENQPSLVITSKVSSSSCRAEMATKARTFSGNVLLTSTLLAAAQPAVKIVCFIYAIFIIASRLPFFFVFPPKRMGVVMRRVTQAARCTSPS